MRCRQSGIINDDVVRKVRKENHQLCKLIMSKTSMADSWPLTAIDED